MTNRKKNIFLIQITSFLVSIALLYNTYHNKNEESELLANIEIETDPKKNSFTDIEYSGFDLNGKNISREVEGLHARVIQHEFDHLNGILYTSRLAHKNAFGYSEEIEQYWKKNEQK